MIAPDILAGSEADFIRSLVEATRQRQSWRERLQWVRDRILDPAFAPAPGHLATLAIYLRLLATGELPCTEDGRHFRPNHHAEAAQQIETALERLATPENSWILRRLYPYLPSWAADFRRSEPLTRIRDIAHRNDIPHDLKQEIKKRLQNKLHRCAGPEDLRTSAEILARVTAPGAHYSPAFVHEFQVFHGELQEFFNASTVEDRLKSLARTDDPADAAAVAAFLSLKAQAVNDLEKLLILLGQLTTLRQRFADRMGRADPSQRSQIRQIDIGLEDFAFTLLSECVNRLEDGTRPLAWSHLLRALALALDNLRLSQIEVDECLVLRTEVAAWTNGFTETERFHLLRVRATLQRCRRLAETYVDRINRLFTPRVQVIGRDLGIADHAIQVFSEGDIRGHVVFQLSKLTDLGLRASRLALQLPPWEAIVPGEAFGTLVHSAALTELEGKSGPFLVLLDQVEGDAEIPAVVRGIILGHPLPQLSHLGVRARQARIPFAAGSEREQLQEYLPWLGKRMRLIVSSDDLLLREEAYHATSTGRISVGRDSNPVRTGLESYPTRNTQPDAAPTEPSRLPVALPEVVLTSEVCVLPLDQARPATSGAKADGARRLWELADRSGGLFRAPRGLVLPFGVMECCWREMGDGQSAYRAMQEELSNAAPDQRDGILQRIREAIGAIPVPETLVSEIATFFGPDTPLAVRSSANGEDLENLAGAGLYESVVNIVAADVVSAIRQVWASLWTRRATLSREQAGIAHERICMAVLLQELVIPDMSFIMHTVHPQTGNRSEALVELAVGLGEILASADWPGTPFRMVCDRSTGAAQLTACASFSVALRPSRQGSFFQERLDYSKVPLAADAARAPDLGRQLGQIASFLEEQLGGPQDVEGVLSADGIHIVQARPQQGL